MTTSTYTRLDAATPQAGDALSLSHVDISYTVRRRSQRVVRDVSFHVARGESFGLVGESGCGKSTIALAVVQLPGPQWTRQRGHDRDRRARRAVAEPLAAATVASREGVDGVPGARPSAEPLDPRRTTGRGGLRDRRAGPQAGAGAGAGDPDQGPHLGPEGSDGPVSPPAFGRHAPARGDRHGAGLRAVPADPRRADHGAGRDRRGRGAGS